MLPLPPEVAAAGILRWSFALTPMREPFFRIEYRTGRAVGLPIFHGHTSEDWQTFDALPADLRKALNDSPWSISARATAWLNASHGAASAHAFIATVNHRLTAVHRMNTEAAAKENA